MKTVHAQAAFEIRRKLRMSYPRTTFYIQSEAGAIHIKWKSGPSLDEIRIACRMYKKAPLQKDEYVSKQLEDMPRVQYIFYKREEA